MGSIGGVVHARVADDGLVSVDMGIPNFDPRALPMEAAAGPGPLAEAPAYALCVDGADLEIGAVSMGKSACRAGSVRCENRAARAVWA